MPAALIRHPIFPALLAAVCLSVASTAHAQLEETTNRIGITMVSIPAGSFLMGACKFTDAIREENKKRAFLGQPTLNANCVGDDPAAEDSEIPQHRVLISAFQLGKTEVTLGQFKQFIAATGRTDLVNNDFMQHNAQGDNTAVTKVSWYDAQDFIAWLNQTEGKGWRLPSEAEWEYACRAGDQYLYCGSNHLARVGWYNNGNRDGRVRAVATKPPNAFGLHDMSGNVWEWVQDVWHDNYAGAPNNGAAWTNGGNQNGRVLRGGSWIDNSNYARATSRFINSPASRYLSSGFRVARTAP